MSSNDVVHRIGVLESRMDRVCKFLSGMYWSGYLEEFKSLQQRVVGSDKSLYEKINEVKVEMEEDVKSKVKISKKKEGLAKEVFSVDMKDNMVHIKIRDENIKEVSEECLEGLSLIMKGCENVSLSGCFRDCKDLTTLTFPFTFNTTNVTNMSEMFYGCNNLSSINLSTFKTGNVTSLRCMFKGCSNLSSLDLSTFSTSSVTSMEGMFSRCHKLASLNLSTFDTSSVTDMRSMFEGCSNLSSLDLSTFNTSSVTNIKSMFSGCSNLGSLNLSTFNTSSVTDMRSMFEGCSNLGSLNLSTFNTSSVTGMGWMFCECRSLTSLDLSTFNTSNVQYMNDMFCGCLKLKNVYVKDERIKSELPSRVSLRTE